MNFFEVPLQAPDEPNIGDLYPGDHIGLWVRWQVKTGTTTIGDDFGVLRIDGEREPESIVTPLPPDPPDTTPPTTKYRRLSTRFANGRRQKQDVSMILQ